MNWFTNIFRRKADTTPAVPLTIQDIGPAPMTPEPDDAELAAQAILETLAEPKAATKTKTKTKKGKAPSLTGEGQGGASADHFRELAKKIRQAHEAARQRTLRFVTFCEEQLQNKDLPDVGKGSLSLLETELYKRIDTVEREGGDLKRRWQHCLAEVTVRRMGINQDE